PVPRHVVQAFVDEHVPFVFKGQWDTDGQIDFAYTAEDIGRFRVNAFQQRGSISVVFRHIKARIPTFEELNLQSERLTKLSQHKDGLILICGPTGCGKSSTMAAMLSWINSNFEKHVVTMEDPIEFTFQDGKSIFNQREIGIDTPSFDLAVRSVLRQNPDIILIGEMRDKVTLETALSAAETGHLVFSTLHSANVVQTLNRMLEFFSPDQHEQIRRQVAAVLRGIICQKLVPALEGGGRVAAQEVLITDSTSRNLILEGHFDKVQNFVESSTETTSVSFNKDLFRLIKEGQISKGDGLKFSPNPQALEMNLKGIFIKT
ncbi:MAG TPA: PilT/PilU family type 4a pilus ATPase, partial [Opitutaceae bacterium]